MLGSTQGWIGRVTLVTAALFAGFCHHDARAQSTPENVPAGGQVVQSGLFFTGVVASSQTFDIPIRIHGFAQEGARLTAIEVQFDVRMSGEYTIQPTMVPPNGIVEAHSVTTLSLGTLELGATSLDFMPLPWMFPVNFPLNILWAQDGSDLRRFTGDDTRRLFRTARPLTMNARIDLDMLVQPKNWATHVAGVFGTWRVTYVFE